MAVGPNPTNALRNIAHTAVTIGDVIDNNVWWARPNDGAGEVVKLMHQLRYDWAVVGDRPIHRYFARSSLAGRSGPVARYSKPILSTHCVERSTPIAQLFRILKDREFAFVLDQDEIRSIVTRADLGAAAVSMVVLAYLIAFEQACVALVRHERIDIENEIPKQRLAKARATHAERRRKRIDTEIFDCLMFSDWVGLIKKCDLAEKYFGMSNTAFKDATGSFADYRNDLAHGRTILAGTTPVHAIERVMSIIDLTERAWFEVDRLASTWDVYSETDLVDAKGRVLAGRGAIERAQWTFDGPVHVISACNPRARRLVERENEAATKLLKAKLRESGFRPKAVEGRAREINWMEPSVLVSGMTRILAARHGHDFEQDAIFEITESEMLVVRCSDGQVMRRSPRVVPK